MERNAGVGDAIELDTSQLSDAARRGQIIAVLGWGDEVHYRVRWADGHESTCFPGPRIRVIRQVARVG